MPRVARIYQNIALPALLQEHFTKTDDGFICDITDTNRWKTNWFGSTGEFSGENGMGLMFCTDGVCPYKNYSS